MYVCMYVCMCDKNSYCKSITNEKKLKLKKSKSFKYSTNLQKKSKNHTTIKKKK